MINEGNITNDERLIRNFLGMVQTRCKDCSLETIEVCKTSKGNWSVSCCGKKVMLVSKSILNDDLVAKYNIKTCGN